MKAYDRLVPEGMAIPYFLYLEVAPGEIDVNIHPTKTEIKFENEQAIWQILSAAVRDGIGKYCEVPSIDFDTQGQPDIPVFNQDMLQESSYTAPKVNYNPDYNPFKQSSGGHSSNTPNQWESLYEGLKQDSFPQDSFPQQPSLFDDDNIVEPQTASEILSEKSPAHYQYKGKYLMTAVKSGLMIIDQHRASVRVLYDRYLKEHDGHVISTQKLLFPETITFSPSEAVNMQQLLPELMAYGFDLSDLGGNTYAVNGIPAGLEGVNPQNLLHDMISSANAADTLVSIQSSLALRLAQCAAIPYGQLLTNDEIESIINDLFSCSNVNYTPDGKAILCILPQGDIERLLG